MDDAPHSPPIIALQLEELTQNMGWLRSLALGLVDDPNDADDLVQAAMSVAVASKTEIQNVRGFLAGSLRKLSWNKRRAERHHADRISLRAQDSPREEPSAEHHLESMETMRVALDEIAKLPELQAQTISLRYVEDLNVSSIAERLGAKPSTVRSNLSRGLETLRGRLDDRFGDRAAWGLTLIPLALPGALPAAGALVAAQSPATSGALNTSAAATKSAAALPSLSLLATGLTMKTISIAVLAPIFLALAYFQLRPGDAPLAPEAPSDLTAGVISAAAPASEQPAAAEPVLAAVATQKEPRSAAPPEPAVAESLAVVDSIDAALTFLDSSDRSQLGHLEVIVTPRTEGSTATTVEGMQAEQTSAEASTSKRILVTDENGRLQIDDLPPGTTHLYLRGRQKIGLGMTPNFLPPTVEIGTEDPVMVMIGPTLPLALSGVYVEEGTPLTFEIDGPGMPTVMEFTGQVSWGDAPFVRPATAFSYTDGEGPWTLIIESEDGLVRGEAQIDRALGTRVEPLSVVLEKTGLGYIHATAEGLGPLEHAMLPYLVLESDNDAAPLLLFERVDGVCAGRSAALAPGTYTWNAPGLVDETGERAQGEVDVLAGETTEVFIPRFGGPHLDRVVIVDASAVPDVDLTRWQLAVVDLRHKEGLALLKPMAARDLGPGMWRVSLGPVPQVGSAISLNSPYDVNGFKISSQSPLIAESGVVETIIVTRDEAGVDVHLRLVDGSTGELITRSEGARAVHFGGQSMKFLGSSDDGRLLAKAVPTDGASQFLCRATGYRMQEVVFEPGNSSTELTVRLLPGWANLIKVVDMGSQTQVEGISVLVNGLDAGVTDAEGRLWIDGEGPPETIELVLGGTEYTISDISPLKNGVPARPDPEDGYGYLLE